MPLYHSARERRRERIKALLPRWLRELRRPLTTAMRHPVYALRALRNEDVLRLAITDGLSVDVPRGLTDYATRIEVVSGRYEFSERTLADMAIRAGDYVVEVGAGIGAVSLGIARAVGKSGRLHAVEMNERAWPWLCRNLKGHSVELHRGFAAAVQTGPRWARTDGSVLGGRVLEWREETGRVSEMTAVNVGEILSSVPNRSWSLVVDIEGGELQFFQELLATGLMARVSQIVVEWHPRLCGHDETDEVRRHIINSGLEPIRRIGFVEWLKR